MLSYRLECQKILVLHTTTTTTPQMYISTKYVPEKSKNGIFLCCLTTVQNVCGYVYIYAHVHTCMHQHGLLTATAIYSSILLSEQWW